MNKREVEAMLNNLPVLSSVPISAEADLQDLLAHPGLPTLLGLVLGSRQAFYATLSRLPLGTAEKSCVAAVIQGKIIGLETIIETVREQAVSSDADEGAER